MSVEKEAGRVPVRILNEEYILKSDGDPEYLEKLARTVDESLRSLRKSFPKLGLSKLAVLTALNLADRFYRLEEEHRRLLAMMRRDGDRGKEEETRGHLPLDKGAPLAGGRGSSG